MNSEKVTDAPIGRTDLINNGLTLLQNDGHLKFGTDALLLAAFVKKAELGAELGAGNGVISLLCAKKGLFSRIDAWEIQPAAAALCLENVKQNGLEERVRVINQDLREISSAVEGNYRAVFTNPPYMKSGEGKECKSTEKQIARHEVAGDIFDFCKAGARLLAFGGDFYCVFRPDRLVDLLEAMRKSDVEPKTIVTVCQSPAHSPSMVLVKGKKGGKAGLYCPPVFFITDGKTQTEDYLYILEHGEFPKKFQQP